MSTAKRKAVRLFEKGFPDTMDMVLHAGKWRPMRLVRGRAIGRSKRYV